MIQKKIRPETEETWARLSSQTATENDKHGLPRHEIVEKMSLITSCSEVYISQEHINK